ncbi:unnamed protein product, partial [Iphiclides podalirius]
MHAAVWEGTEGSGFATFRSRLDYRRRLAPSARLKRRVTDAEGPSDASTPSRLISVDRTCGIRDPRNGIPIRRAPDRRPIEAVAIRELKRHASSRAVVIRSSFEKRNAGEWNDSLIARNVTSALSKNVMW